MCQTPSESTKRPFGSLSHSAGGEKWIWGRQRPDLSAACLAMIAAGDSSSIERLRSDEKWARSASEKKPGRAYDGAASNADRSDV